MQPTEPMPESNPVDPQPSSGEKDLLRDALRDQADRGRTKSDIVLLSVQRLLHRGAITNLAKMLGRMHQADVAQVIMHLSSPKEKREVFELVRGESKRGQVLSELDTRQHQSGAGGSAALGYRLADQRPRLLTTSPTSLGCCRKSARKRFSR